MIGDAAPAPILTVPVAAPLTWTQHTGGGCRCLCRIYHPGVGSGACSAAAEPGLLIRLDVPHDPDRVHQVPGAAAPLPVCACCYRLLAVPTTPIEVLRAGLDDTIARHGTRTEAAAVALLAETRLLGHLGIRRHIVDEELADDDGNYEHIVRVTWWALIGDTEHLDLDLGQELVLELALSLARGEPVDLADTLAGIDPGHRRAVADAVSIALGLTDSPAAHDTATSPDSPS